MTVTPVTLVRHGNDPRFPEVRIPGSLTGAALKAALTVHLTAAGVTCDLVLQVLDDVRQDPGGLARWVTVI